MVDFYYLVFGGELVQPGHPQYRDPDAIQYAGKFTTKQAAHDEWKARSWQNVDNAHMRFEITTTGRESFDQMVAAKVAEGLTIEQAERQIVIQEHR